MPSKAIDTTTTTDLAVVAPVLDITADDIVLPRIYIGQAQSNAVDAKTASVGDIYSSSSQDGTDAEVLLAESEMDKSDGVLMHVLSMRKGKSYIDPDSNELQSFAFDDPEAPFEADTTYNYMVCLPDFDQQLPYKLLLKRAGAPTARIINTILSKSIGDSPCWAVPLLLKTIKRTNPKGSGTYYVARVMRKAIESPAEIKKHKSNVALCAELAQIVAGPVAAASTDSPSI